MLHIIIAFGVGRGKSFMIESVDDNIARMQVIPITIM